MDQITATYFTLNENVVDSSSPQYWSNKQISFLKSVENGQLSLILSISQTILWQKKFFFLKPKFINDARW